MNVSSKLGLGTVQWGLPYGIANKVGLPTTLMVSEMLQFAQKAGIRILDTAHSYGDSEDVLGTQEAVSKGFCVVTKTKPLQTQTLTVEQVSDIVQTFRLSLKRLKTSKVHGLLVHQEDQLLKPGSDFLWTALQQLKIEGDVEKVGVSVYHPKQLEDILSRYPIDLVQLPFSIYDQRFLQTGLLKRLKELDVEIHSRSAFLQGLLLLSPEQLPAQFSDLRDSHFFLHKTFQEGNVTPLEGCLLFCLNQPHIDKVIVGCENSIQIRQMCDIVNMPKRNMDGFQETFALNDLSILNPSRWHGREIQNK